MTTYNRSMGRSKSDNSFIHSDDGDGSGKITLYEELRLIERDEDEINAIWKGAHMTLFFMAFVFGSFCTCCFHMLMRMFDDKCILYPKVISHSSISSIVREFFSLKSEKESKKDKKPIDYVSTQWAEISVCYLPTYVPLVSGLAGLTWTTMFFMCSSSTSTGTGSQRLWRALPLMFVFSVAMATLCIYASSVTHSGLKELCYTLAQFTGGSPNSYTINVVTLAYQHRIRGVYQATLLSIASAWFHTTCWILSALLVVLRVLLAVDFTLVRVKAQLIGNRDDMLLKYEQQVDTISADLSGTPKSGVREDDSEEEMYDIGNTTNQTRGLSPFQMTGFDTLDKTTHSRELSQISLVPAEKERLEHKFINRLVKDLVNNIGKPVSRSSTANLTDANRSSGRVTPHRSQTRMSLKANHDNEETVDAAKAEKIAKDFMRKLRRQLNKEFKEFEQAIKSNANLQSFTSAADIDRRVRLHSSSDDESKVTEDSSKTHQHIKKYKTKDDDRNIDNTGKKDGPKTDTVRKHIRLNVSDESDEASKLSQDYQKEKSDEKNLIDKRSDETVEKYNRDEKAEYSGLKRAQVKFEYKTDKNNKEPGNDGKKEEYVNTENPEVNEGIKTVQPSLRISDDAKGDDKTASEKDKIQEKEEKKGDASSTSKYVDKTDDSGKSDNKYTKDTDSQDTKDKPR